MISFGRDELSLEKGKTNDWVLPNGIGGYASSTAIGMNTRKYHGLLIGADENLNRTLYLSKIEETLVIDGKEFPLSLNQYTNNTVHPEGHKLLERFDFSDIAKYVYNANGVLVEKTILVVRGENTVVVNYKVLNAGGSEVNLILRPLINIRDFHSNTAGEQEYASRKIGNGFFIGAPKPLFVISDICQYTEEPSTIYNMAYERELQRQTGELDNHFSPGYFTANPQKGEVNIIASTAEINFARVREKLAEEAQRKKRLIDNYYEKNSIPHDWFATALLLAADSFVIKKEGKTSIIAGYHWFSEWTRDILISLPGIFLSTHRFEEAGEALSYVAGKMNKGALPNVIGSEEINADSPLWFINACYLYAMRTDDYGLIEKKLWGKMREAFTSYLEGNEYYEVDRLDALVRIKKEGATWMDARSHNGNAITPRVGKPVEINALWYNAAVAMAGLCEKLEKNEERKEYLELANKIRASFEKFYNPKKRSLYDIIEPYDDSTRPNQLLAVSLSFSPLDTAVSREVFAHVFKRLYTPVGLRSLSPSSPQYREYYSGNQAERDLAYHNGTIWPYFLGAFLDAHTRVFRRNDASAIELLEPFEENLKRYGIGTINEIFEAKTMRPDGCVSQAWTVAEALRIYTDIKKEGIHWV